MTNYSTINVKPLSGNIGAEIDGVNLKKITKEQFKEIKIVFGKYGVIFFRNQLLTSEQHIALASKFGPLETHAYVKGLSKFPEIIRIIKCLN